jgi:outer membrane protein OmpA-like peptidoglycan-associated protein
VSHRTFSSPVFALVALVSLPLSASAQSIRQTPAYTEKDIIERFAPTNLGSPRGVGPLGASRGICIGTEADCPTMGVATAPAAPAPEPVLDLVVTFGHNSDELTEASKQNLNEFAKALRNEKLSKVSFLVEGHTDARGDHRYNLDLSERRAQAVVRHLTTQGVDSSKVVAKGYGETKPRSFDPLDPGNRRVETRVNTISSAQASR